MNKFISTIILATFVAVCSFGAAAGSDADKNKETMRKDSSGNKSRETGSEYGKEPSSTSEVMKNQMPKDLSPEELKKFKDQEVMNKKPYKQ